jgi:hypothetical protein
MKQFFSSAILAALVFTSCSKDPILPDPPTQPDQEQPNPPTPPNPSDSTPPVDTSATDHDLTVYIAGDSFDRSTSYISYPIYWKNGVQVHLPSPGYTSANAIAVSGHDVYVSNSGESYGNIISYWKNETPVQLPGAVIYPAMRGITVAGDDVYALGIGYNADFQTIPVYWKNQAPFSISPLGESDARSVAVAGDDVYIAGSTPPPGAYGVSPACYWKNGSVTFLYSQENLYETGLAKAILVTNGDVHIAGDVYFGGAGLKIGTGFYWKNDVPMPLTGHDSISYANAIALDGNDVYIAGAVAGPDHLLRAAYWKNGALTVLDQNNWSEAMGIAVFEGDVYVVGNLSIHTAILWKNNTTIELGRGRANAIVVKRFE